MAPANNIKIISLEKAMRCFVDTDDSNKDELNASQRTAIWSKADPTWALWQPNK